MPIWAYFMGKASEDPNCGIDTRMTFAKPEGASEISIDYMNANAPILNAEGDENGSVKPSDYDAGTYIIPESDTSLTIRKSEPKSEGNKDPKKTGDKPTIPATLPKKEKAIMPPPVKKQRG